jgi:hypothetical protein
MLSPKEFLLQRSSLYINNNGVYTIIPISKKKGISDLTFHSKRIYNSYLLLSNIESIDFSYHIDDRSSIDHNQAFKDVIHQYHHFESLIRRKISTTLQQYHLDVNEIHINVDVGDDVDDSNYKTQYYYNNQHSDYSSELFNYSNHYDGYITLSTGKLKEIDVDDNNQLQIDAMFTASTSVNRFVDNSYSCNNDDDDTDGAKDNSYDDYIEYENDVNTKQHTHHSEFIIDFVQLSRHPVRAKYIRWIMERREHELTRRPFVNESILYHYSSTSSTTGDATAISTTSTSVAADTSIITTDATFSSRDITVATGA